jgi:hypothetical protein
MRQVLCRNCGTKYPTSELKILLMPRSSIGEPAEYARVMKGLAKVPTKEQRTIHVNDIPMPLENGHYNCDLCMTKIYPDDNATCVTIWVEGQQVPNLWEHDFIKSEEA